MMDGYEISKAFGQRIGAAVRGFEQSGGGVRDFPMAFGAGRVTLARLLVESPAGKWTGVESRIKADGAGFEDVPGGLAFDASFGLLWSLGAPAVANQVVLVQRFPLSTGSPAVLSPVFAFFADPPRVTHRITGNADFGAALWDGASTVGTDEMWEEYAELNLATGRYEKKARKLFGACP